MILQKYTFRFSVVLVLLTINFNLFAQHEADFWYFGNHAGLDFSSGNPEPLTDGALYTFEGCATTSDSAGNLLFYTNGVTVWNKEHQIMENGDGLMGDTSSSQSAVIVPYPQHDSLFFLFTTDQFYYVENQIIEHDGFRYSLINMNINNGLGRVIEKNVLLLDSTLEKITCVQHSNGKDFWVITHEWRTNNFNSWLVDETGISNTPVVSSIGFEYTEVINSPGYLKVSPDGSHIVSAILFNLTISIGSLYEIFNFDNTSGNITDSILLYFNDQAYGCEFSSDGSKLYMTNNDKIMQVDMLAGTPDQIINSLTEVYELENQASAIQLANNGKLYISVDSAEYLSLINNPNELPANCNFEENAIYLDGRTARLGLPNFIQSYFKEPFFKTENTCVFDEAQFVMSDDIVDIDSVIWNFGDPASGGLNISRELIPVHIFSEPGIYKVTLRVWYNNVSNDYNENIKIIPLPEIFLGNDTVFCYNDFYILEPIINSEVNNTSDHFNYVWNDMSTEAFLVVDQSGEYRLEIENIYTSCKNSDTINIIFSDPPEIDLGNDTSFCENTSYFMDVFVENCSYLWQDLSEYSYFTVYEPGTYFVELTNEHACKNSDTIILTQIYLPRFNFLQDTVLCEGTSIELSFNFVEETEYLWQDGTGEDHFYVNEPGLYSLRTMNICGIWEDSVYIDYEYCGDLIIPNVFTPGNDDLNETFFIKGINKTDWKLSLFNRWGQRVKYYERYDNSWTGNDLFENELTAGVYYYILSNIKTGDLYKGTVRIIR